MQAQYSLTPIKQCEPRDRRTASLIGVKDGVFVPIYFTLEPSA
jgi:hypothetical protein